VPGGIGLAADAWGLELIPRSLALVALRLGLSHTVLGWIAPVPATIPRTV
jgi:hypothetical protein